MTNLARLRSFVADMTRLVAKAGSDEAQVLGQGEALLRALVGEDDWLP